MRYVNGILMIQYQHYTSTHMTAVPVLYSIPGAHDKGLWNVRPSAH